MASKINTSTIDITYPIAGQDNDTKGFRDNFSSIKNNFSTAASEISELQDDLAKSPVLTNPPVSPSANGTAGQIAYDSTHIYICVASNTWRRAEITGSW